MISRTEQARSAYAEQAAMWLREFHHDHGARWTRIAMDGIADALASYGTELDDSRASYYRLQSAADRAVSPILARDE